MKRYNNRETNKFNEYDRRLSHIAPSLRYGIWQLSYKHKRVFEMVN